MLSSSDKRIILNMIQTGDFYKSLNFEMKLSDYTNAKIRSSLRGTDIEKINYSLAGKLVNILISQDSKIKKNINNLISFELNYYKDDKYKRDQIYKKLNILISNLLAFPPKKRIQKFLVKFVMSSKALQSVVSKNNDNFGILKTLQNISLEVKNVSV